MYTRGKIIFFTPFFFPDGSLPQNKYFLILEEGITANNVLASLTTKKDCVPGSISQTHGCIDDPSINFNCYRIEKDHVITKNGWSFPKDTYIYGYRLALFSLAELNSKYKIVNVDFQIKGDLLDDEYQAILRCLRNSPTVKRKFRRILGATI